MSIQVSALVWLIPFTPPAKKLVAICVADTSNEHGVSWPSLATIADRCVISKDSAKRYVAELEKEGWLKREPRFRGNGGQSSNDLRFNIAKLDCEAKRARKKMVRQSTEERSPEDEFAGVDETINATATPTAPMPRGGGHPCPGGRAPMPRGEGTHAPGGRALVPPQVEPSVKPSVEPSAKEEERASAQPLPVPKVEASVSKPRRTSRNAQPSPEARAIIQAFAEVYRARFRVAYVPNPMEDGAAATFMVDQNISPEQVASTFEAATRSNGYWASKATTLPVLFRRWAAIQAELTKPLPVREASGASDSQVATEEWLAGMNGE